MQLHENAKQQMLGHMAEDLAHLIVKNGKFLDRMSGFLSFYRANNALPTQGRLAQSLGDWIGDFPFIEFASDFLADELSLEGEYVGGEDRRPISQIPGYEDLPALAQRLVASFETLPWKYALTLKLGANLLPPLPGDGTSFPLGDSKRVVVSDLLLAEEFPLASPNEAIEQRLKGSGILAILQEAPLSWDSDAAYFQTELEGYIGPYGGGNPMDRATSRLKSFLGLGLAIGLFAHRYKYDPSPPRLEWFVHRKDGDGWAVRNKVSLDDDDTRVVRGLRIWDKFGAAYPEAHKIPWLQSVLGQVSAALSSQNSAILSLAAQWYWDSFKGTDEVLRYVRRMTTLEILLGEGANTSEASLGEILGNRLAYLIGTTHKERSDVLGDFRKIYNIRSRILHRGKHRLVGEERVTMTRLQTLCERALKEEAKIVAAPDKA